MLFQTKLLKAKLIRRYKRFLADIQFCNGNEVTAHCPNTGSMLGLQEKGMKIWVEPNNDPLKKLSFGWRLTELGDGTQICIDTNIANKIIREALLARTIKNLSAYHTLKAEVSIGNKSRIDFGLYNKLNDLETLVEVKSVTLKRKLGYAEFPDSISERGRRHLDELSLFAKKKGKRAVLLFLVQRADCERFRVAEDIDPEYAKAYYRAKQNGVEIRCLTTNVNPKGIYLDRELVLD